MEIEDELIKTVRNDRFAAYIGATLTKVEVGYAEAQMSIEEKHLNGVGIVQGGVLFTLADYAFAAASNAAGIITVGINASISFLKPAKGKTLVAKAREVFSSRSLCDYTVEVFDVENDKMIAKFNGTGFKRT